MKRVAKGEARATPRNGGPPRQGEERGGRRGSPQALTGGVSALRLLHELVGWASGEREISPWSVTSGLGDVRSGAVFFVVADCAALCGAWPEVHSPGGCVWRPVLV